MSDTITRICDYAETQLVLAKHHLSTALDFVIAESTSNDVPYHNLAHCLTVTRLSAKLSYLTRLPEAEERALVLAAIFHDFSHSAGHEEDSVNVTTAIAGLRRYCELHEIDEQTTALAVDNIAVTQYPFIHKPKTLAQKIIRDADILQSLDGDREAILLGGLRKEMSVKLKRKISRGEFAEGQVSFLKQLKLFTTPGQVLFDAAKDQLFLEFGAIADKYKRKLVRASNTRR